MSLALDPVQPRIGRNTGYGNGSDGTVDAGIATRLVAKTLPRFALGLTAFLGAFVINEPAPYELFLLCIMVLFLLFGMRLSRSY